MAEEENILPFLPPSEQTKFIMGWISYYPGMPTISLATAMLRVERNASLDVE